MTSKWLQKKIVGCKKKSRLLKKMSLEGKKCLSPEKNVSRLKKSRLLRSTYSFEYFYLHLLIAQFSFFPKTKCLSSRDLNFTRPRTFRILCGADRHDKASFRGASVEKLSHVSCILQDVNTTQGATHGCILYHYQFP